MIGLNAILMKQLFTYLRVTMNDSYSLRISSTIFYLFETIGTTCPEITFRMSTGIYAPEFSCLSLFTSQIYDMQEVHNSESNA